MAAKNQCWSWEKLSLSGIRETGVNQQSRTFLTLFSKHLLSVQVGPAQPGAHTHSNPRDVSKQLPPLWQGSERQACSAAPGQKHSFRVYSRDHKAPPAPSLWTHHHCCCWEPQIKSYSTAGSIFNAKPITTLTCTCLSQSQARCL